jgi:hypothetical protein
MQEAWDKSSRTADGFYSSQTPTSECATSCYDEGCKLERELAHAIRERDEWEAKFIQQNKDLGCEQMDPNGTIWDYAKTLQRDLDELRRERDEARDAAVKAKAYKRLLKQTNAQLKRERDELKALLTKARDSVREMRDILKAMNFGDNFPRVARAISNADDILSNNTNEERERIANDALFGGWREVPKAEWDAWVESRGADTLVNNCSEPPTLQARLHGEVIAIAKLYDGSNYHGGKSPKYLLPNASRLASADPETPNP